MADGHGYKTPRTISSHLTRQLIRRGPCRFEAAWKDPECDLIYEHLRREMEIDRRYEALEDKVSFQQFVLSWSIYSIDGDEQHLLNFTLTW